MVGLKILKSKKSEGLSVYPEKKSMTINSEETVPVLEVTNEYGNTVSYEISDDYPFDNLFALL